MSGFLKKKLELESQQADLETKLGKLKLQARLFEKCDGPIFHREAQGLERKLTNVKMKLRSMEIKRKQKSFGSLSKSLPISNSRVSQENCSELTLLKETNTEQAPAEIEEVDDEFDPTESNYVHERPVRRMLPDIPLPHSELQWKSTVPVARWRHLMDCSSLLEGLNNGHFLSVEAEKPKVGVEMKKTGGCNCDRPATLIRCEGECGFTVRGRLSITCPAHPGIRHLMDHGPHCPHCSAVLVADEDWKIKCANNNNTILSNLAPDCRIIKPKLKIQKKVVSSICKN